MNYSTFEPYSWEVSTEAERTKARFRLMDKESILEYVNK